MLLPFFILVAAAVAGFPSSCLAASVTLAWDPSPGQEDVDYKVYYGPTPGAYTEVVDAGSSTNVTISGLEPGAEYFFAATAMDAAGLESAFSNEVAYTVPLGLGRIQLAVDPIRGLVLKGTGEIGHTYYIQASRDLITWQVVNTVTVGQSENFEVLNPVPGNVQACYFRLSVNP